MKDKTKSRILSYVIALSMATSLVGCQKFKYDTDSQGNIVVNGKIDYQYLAKDYVLLEVKILDKSELYIASIIAAHKPFYKDIFTNKTICYYRSENIINISDLNDYLFSYNEIKNEYTIDDVERIYDEIKEDYYLDAKEKAKGKM